MIDELAPVHESCIIGYAFLSELALADTDPGVALLHRFQHEACFVCCPFLDQNVQAK